MKTARLALLVIVACLGGCTVTMGTHAPSLDTTVMLRDGTLPALSVGDFRLAPGADSGIDKSVTSRSAVLHPPTGNSFAAYLRECLISDLKSAGKYDPNAPGRITGELVANTLSTGISEGHSTVSARFKLMRGDELLFDKEIAQNDTWGSSFVGAVAIPDAINHYSAQYGHLLDQLYKDEQFRAAGQKAAAR